MRLLHAAALILTLMCAVQLFAFDAELPVQGTYAVPQGWNTKSEADRVTLTSADGGGSLTLTIYRDKRESWRVADEYLATIKQDTRHEIKVVSKDIFHRGGREIARVSFTMQQKRAPKILVSVVAVPVEGGNLVLIAWAKESDYRRYGEAFDVVLKSVMPKETERPAPFPVTNAAVGLKLQVAPDWTVEPQSQGEHSGAPYLKITRDNALLSLSSNEDKRTADEYLRFVEKNTREQSKGYEQVSIAPQTIAGMSGTRLELLTLTQSGVKVRRVLLVFSRGDRHYVVAAGAPESEYGRYAADFKSMIDSVALAE